MKNQGCLLMGGGRGLDFNRQSLLRNTKVFLLTVPKVGLGYIGNSEKNLH